MIKNYVLTLLFFFCAFVSFGQVTLSEWTLNANNNPSNVAANVISSNFSRGTGVGAISYGGNGAFSNGWSTGAIDLDDYFEVSISPDTGFNLNIEDVLFSERRSGTGIRDYQVSWSTDNFVTSNTISTVNVPDNTGERVGNITGLSLSVNDGETIIFRFYGYNAEAGGGTWRINDNSLELIGTVTTAVVADPNLTISGTTDHGSSCSGNAASTITYTITNSGTLSANGIAVSPNDTQFAVSGLSSTIIAPSSTATFNVTFTPTAVGAQTAILTVTSSTATSNTPTLDINGTGISVPTLTQPTNQNTVIPNTATFSLSSGNAASYQWQVSTNGGSTWTNVTDGSGVTTASYTTAATFAPMDGNLYRCLLTNICGSTISDEASLALTNSTPSNAQSLSGCFEDTSVELFWNNPATPPTGGYVIFAIQGTTNPTAPLNDANTYTANANFNAAPFETPTSLGKVVYKGNGTSATVIGLTEDETYSFRIFAYNGESLSAWSNGTSAGSNYENVAQDDVRNLNATPLTNQVNLSWLNPTPTACWEQLIIVANQGSVSFAPSGNGSAYTGNDNDIYSSPNQLVYETTSSVTSKAITGLTNGTNYCFKVFIRRGTTWSEGVEICAVPSLTYCSAEGTTSYDTGITGVAFNTINNNGTSANNSYTDYTSISTSVALGELHNLGVIVNIDGNIDVFTRVWIDWNQDGSFNTTGEQYDLGTASNPSSTVDLNTATSNSPISVEIPNNAAIGATRMRVATKYNAYPTSCESGYSGEVEDYTIVITQPVNAEINIKGNNISIANGFNAPFGLNNTLFGSTDVGSAGPEKIFFIENIGATTLLLSGTPRVELIGAHPGDFTVTLQPSATIGSASVSEFRIQFFPSADGARTATVRIQNSDSNEAPYLFDIEGTAVCSTALTSSIWPTEGPEQTEITITSATDLTGATASINGVNLSVESSSPSELIVSVPAGASSGNLTVLFSTGCSSVNSFTVIDNLIGGCETATSTTVPLDLFISEISDATSGSSSVIEIFNGTASPIDLADYSIRVFNNGSLTPSTTANLMGMLASGGVHVIGIGTTSCDLAANGLTSGLPHQTFNSAGGINFDNNSSDAIELYNSTTGTSIDVFGELGNSSWANSLAIDTDGVNYRRQNTAASLPTTSFDITEWDEIDWTSCGDSSYSDFGTYDFSLGVPPSVAELLSPTFNCTNAIQITATGTEGITGGVGLSYQWYYLAPNASTFTVIPDNADFDNVTTATLDIINPLGYDNYQFYCQVRENSATCYKASNAVKIEVITAVWDGTWSSAPAQNKRVIIDAAYDTSSQSSFSACNLVVNDVLLNITDGHFVQVENDLIVNGPSGFINIAEEGSFVQINDSGTVSATIPTNLMVNKRTAPSNNWYEYTYWSSPVFEETPANGLFGSNPNRRYEFNAAYFRDSFYETGNDGSVTSGAGIDDIDDGAPYDWQPISTTYLVPGVGYAATHDPAVFASTPGCPGPTCRIGYIFSGLFNNGVVTVPVFRNDSETGDTNWNFVGNPYPSAISADTFLATNTGIIEGAIYLWSQNTVPTTSTNGNENMNFSQSDYAIINGTGATAAEASGGDPTIPSRFIPSGQGFFVAMNNVVASATSMIPSPVTGNLIRTADLTFNNAMRVTGNNNQFFRSATETALDNKLWLNLTTDNGAFSQVLIGYLENATDGYDGLYFDAPRNASTDFNTIIYTNIPDVNKKFAIQGKNTSSLSLEEIIPLGFNTSIDEATLYTLSLAQTEGDFMTSNTIYIKDNLLNITADLTANPYTFTSETGEFNNRFEIVFTPTSLSVADTTLTTNDLSITERADGTVAFSVGNGYSMTNIRILDVLGREVYQLPASGSLEVYDLSKLSKAAYIAQVTLSNGQVLHKKAIKQY